MLISITLVKIIQGKQPKDQKYEYIITIILIH